MRARCRNCRNIFILYHGFDEDHTVDVGQVVADVLSEKKIIEGYICTTCKQYLSETAPLFDSDPRG